MTATGPRAQTSFCRICAAQCGIRVELTEGRVARVMGDRANPLSAGFTCAKGRALPAQINHPARLLRSLRRTDTGGFEPVASDVAIREIAARTRRIVDQHGPRAVALYSGNGVLAHSAGNYLGQRLLRAIGSPMWFSAATIDQPGKELALSLHGRWGGGLCTFADADVWLFVGTNPLVSLWAGTGISNPVATLRQARNQGMSMIVLDPRRTETAELADVYLPLRPGSDATLIAGILRLLFHEGLVDTAFCQRNVDGVDALRAAVEPFTAELVRARCDVPFEDMVRAARIIGTARRGGATAGTGPNMAGTGTLIEYLLLALMSVAGLWARAGDAVASRAVLGKDRSWTAQPQEAAPIWDWDEPLLSRALPRTTMGMPTGGAADEILMDDPRRVRALFVVAGNPVMTWPDQHKVVEAMKHLDLLVCMDIFETPTTRFADYVIAGKHQLEVSETSLLMENAGASSAAGRHWQLPYAMYSPAVVEPPADSDVIDESQFFFRLAQAMNLQLKVRGVPLNMTSEPRVDELLSIMAEGGRVPLATVMTHPSGYVETDSGQTIAAPSEDNGARLHVGHEAMVKKLGALTGPSHDDPQRPYRLISRRMREVCNSIGQNIPELVRGRPYNPAFMHPDDLRRLGVAPGDLIEVASETSAMVAVAEAEDRLRPGTVSCAHGWSGTNTNRLVGGDVHADEWSGIPLMSAIPVAVRAYDHDG